MIDKRDKLLAEPFSYKATKGNKVFLYGEKKQVKTIKSQAAEEFLATIKHLDEFDAQLLMAELLGRVYSVISSFALVLTPIAFATAPIIITSFGVVATLHILAGLTFSVSLIFLFLLKTYTFS